MGEWRAIYGNGEIIMHSDGRASVNHLDEWALPDNCLGGGDLESAEGTWKPAAGGGFEIAITQGVLEFHYDTWYGKPRENKALVIPCADDTLRVFAKVEN